MFCINKSTCRANSYNTSSKLNIDHDASCYFVLPLHEDNIDGTCVVSMQQNGGVGTQPAKTCGTRSCLSNTYVYRIPAHYLLALCLNNTAYIGKVIHDRANTTSCSTIFALIP